MSFEIKMITGTIQVVTGLHIGAGNSEMHIGGTDNPVIKNILTNEPYIPGSSLKGKMRSLLQLYTGKENDENVAKLFGVSASDDKVNKTEKIGITRLAFWDCFMSEAWRKRIKDEQIICTEVKLENTIDRKTGTSNNLRNTERVLPGTEFDFKLSLKVFDNENLLSIVLGTMKLLEADSLGGSGSRGYGKIKFKNLQINGKDIQQDLDEMKPFEKRFVQE